MRDHQFGVEAEECAGSDHCRIFRRIRLEIGDDAQGLVIILAGKCRLEFEVVEFLRDPDVALHGVGCDPRGLTLGDDQLVDLSEDLGEIHAQRLYEHCDGLILDADLARKTIFLDRGRHLIFAEFRAFIDHGVRFGGRRHQLAASVDIAPLIDHYEDSSRRRPLHIFRQLLQPGLRLLHALRLLQRHQATGCHHRKLLCGGYHGRYVDILAVVDIEIEVAVSLAHHALLQ